MFFKKKKASIEIYNVAQVKDILRQKQVVWAWCEPCVGAEWREVICDGNDLCLKYSHVYFIDYSLHDHRRLPQAAKWFVLTSEKPNFVFNPNRE
jgi:hypothetical protein